MTPSVDAVSCGCAVPSSAGDASGSRCSVHSAAGIGGGVRVQPVRRNAETAKTAKNLPGMIGCRDCNREPGAAFGAILRPHGPAEGGARFTITIAAADHAG